MSKAGDLEFRPLHYVIAAERLLSVTERHDGEFLDWPTHLRESHPGMFVDFREAFTLAIHRRLDRTKGWKQWPAISRQLDAAFNRSLS